MTLSTLYARIIADGISIDDVRTRELKAAAFPQGWILYDSTRFVSDRELKCVLAHEYGHCKTGSFYNIYSPYDLKEKCEYKANKYAVHMLMPYNEVWRALHKGCWTAWALADYFDVTEDFAQMALNMYADSLKGLNQFRN
jgi:Zn-dependent peptidase ImmA (M78 family)